MIQIDLAIGLCEKWEGFRSKPYLDKSKSNPVKAPDGYWTIGFGSRTYMDGRNVTENDPPISREDAHDLMCGVLLTRVLPSLLFFSPKLQFTPRAANGLLSFCYNLGAKRYGDSTLRKYVDGENWEKAKVEILKWCHEGQVEVQGLLNRRKDEAALLGTDQ